MHGQWDLVIIGAGPSGMCAAVEAVKQGLSVLVVDRQAKPGGQIFRNAGSAPAELRALLGSDYARGNALIKSFTNCGATFTGGATVWHLTPGRVYVSCDGASHVILAKQILIATGAMERPVPVPGWTLPGVMGAGAADILAKAGGLKPEGPVVICGNGPLILQIVTHLKHMQTPIAGVVLSNDLINIGKAMFRFPGALLRPKYLMHGMSMGMRLLGAQCYPQSRGVSISKNSDGFSVEFRSLGRKRSLNGTTVLLHEGVISENRVTRLARCNHVWETEQRYWHVETDIWGKTNRNGIRVAGDCAKVRGADAAMALGKLAAWDICRELGCITLAERDSLARRTRCDLQRYNAMQPFMDRVFAPVPECLQPTDETIVCRCEELTAGELRRAIVAGCYSTDALKAQARPGMGACQGRMCVSAVSEMIAQTQGLPIETVVPYHAQPPLFPLTLGELASMRIAPEGL